MYKKNTLWSLLKCYNIFTDKRGMEDSMDKYTVDIVILGSNELKECVDCAAPLERLTIRSAVGSMENINEYGNVDLFIVESDISRTDIEEIIEKKADYAEIVLVIKDEAYVQQDEAYFGNFYDVWLQNSPMITYQISTLQKRLLRDLDVELERKELDVLIDSVPDLVWYKDIRGAHNKVNDAFCKTVNKTKEQIKGRGHCYIWDLDTEEYEQGEYVCMETEDIVIEEQKTFLFHEKVKIGDEMRQLNTYKSAIVGRRGETVGTVGIAHDVTDMWNTHEEFKTLINNLPFPMMLVDASYDFISGNAWFEELFSYSEEKHENFDIKSFGQLYFGNDISYEDQENVSCPAVLQREGLTYHYILEKSPICDVFQKKTGYFYIFRDITMRYEYEARLKQLSEIDELSQLNNRKVITRFFDEDSKEIIKAKQSVAIFMLDLDYFKKYNDYYGHIEGDKVIQILGSILRDFHNDKDMIVARYGGEEFFLVVAGKTEKEIKELAEYILTRIRDEKIEHKTSPISDYVSASMGISYHNIINEEMLSGLIREADDALYSAKNLGKDRFVLKSYVTEQMNNIRL